MIRKLLPGAVLLAVAAAALLVWQRQSEPQPTRVFVSNYRSDTVSVVDPALAREVKVIPVEKGPIGLALRGGATPQIGVANSTGNTVTLIDPDTMAVVGTLPVGKGPESIAFSPDGTLLYANSPYDLTVTRTDAVQGRPAGDPLRFDRRPGELVLSPDGRRLYVLIKDPRGEVVAIDTAQWTVVGTMPVGKSPTGIALSSDGGRLLAASFDDSTISVIDTAKLAVLSTIEAPTGLGLIAHPTQPLVFSLASFDDSVAVVDFAAGKVAGAIDVGQWPTYGAISSDGRTLYVPNEDSDNLAIIDVDGRAVTVRVAVGDEPAHALIIPGR